MPERAHVSSVDALERFRSNLIVYLTKARSTLEEVSSDVQRMRGWLEGEQRAHWEGEVRRRSLVLQDAQQALFSARLSTFREAGSVEQMMVQRAKRAVEQATDKLRVVKQWNRTFDNHADPLVKQMEKLHSVLAHDMVQAVASLAQTINTLHIYAGVTPAPVTGSETARDSSAEPEGAA